MVKAYMTSYKLPCIITRGNNVYGPHQFPEKLVPKFTLLAKRGEQLPVHGGGQVWLLLPRHLPPCPPHKHPIACAASGCPCTAAARCRPLLCSANPLALCMNIQPMGASTGGWCWGPAALQLPVALNMKRLVQWCDPRRAAAHADILLPACTCSRCMQATAVACLPDPVLWLEPLLIEHGALQELFRAQHNNICVQGGMEGGD